MTLSSGQFWFTMIIIVIILLFPVIAIRFYNITVHPTLSDRCRIRQRYLRKKALTQPYDPYVRRKSSSAFRSRRSIRSGYAFAHQEGFGHLITSGKIMRKTQGYNLHVPSNHLSPAILYDALEGSYHSTGTGTTRASKTRHTQSGHGNISAKASNPQQSGSGFIVNRNRIQPVQQSLHYHHYHRNANSKKTLERN